MGQSITVDIYGFSNSARELLSTVIANQSRPDIAALLGDNGMHGFSYTLPPRLHDEVQRLIIVYFEIGGTIVRGAQSISCSPTYLGKVDSVSCIGITGWAAAEGSLLNQSLGVGLWDGFHNITSTTANVSRPDIGTKLGDNGLHGFTLPIPLEYQDAHPHTFQVLFGPTGVTIPGSPVTFTCGTAGLQFYAVYPCRIADTRATPGFTGAFGPPSLAGPSTRTFPIPSSACGIPSNALAYSLNFTVVPPANGPQANLTTWPAGLASGMPNVSTLNYSNRVVANAAIVPSGTNGSINVFANYPTDVLFDINGYFAPPTSAFGWDFYPLTPCRIADTRAASGFAGAFGPPSMPGLSTRPFDPTASPCRVPAPLLSAYSLNFTVVPPSSGPQTNLTTWSATRPSMPNVSTLNFAGDVVANAAIVVALFSPVIDVFVNYPTDVLFDINGYFAPPTGSGLRF